MKCKIESDGKTHIVTLTAENVFEQSAIDAISCYGLTAKIYKSNINENNETKENSSMFSNTLKIEMENN